MRDSYLFRDPAFAATQAAWGIAILFGSTAFFVLIALALRGFAVSEPSIIAISFAITAPFLVLSHYILYKVTLLHRLLKIVPGELAALRNRWDDTIWFTDEHIRCLSDQLGEADGLKEKALSRGDEELLAQLEVWVVHAYALVKTLERDRERLLRTEKALSASERLFVALLTQWERERYMTALLASLEWQTMLEDAAGQMEDIYQHESQINDLEQKAREFELRVLP